LARAVRTWSSPSTLTGGRSAEDPATRAHAPFGVQQKFQVLGQLTGSLDRMTDELFEWRLPGKDLDPALEQIRGRAG
jgi:hypothetical protein